MRKLSKIVVVFFILTFLFPASLLCQPLPFSTEHKDWAIGPFVPLEPFDMGVAKTTLGNLYSIEKGSSPGNVGVMFFKFENGEIAVLEEKIYSVSVRSKNLKTTRGIEVGSTLSDVVEKYGIPRQIRKEDKVITKYFYSYDGRYLSFDATDKGIIIQVNIMYDWN